MKTIPGTFFFPLCGTLATSLLVACQGLGASGEPLVEYPTPSAERLTADVAWLADDAREGRRAGTAGEREAADYLSSAMESIGLEPAGTVAPGLESYQQIFQVDLARADGGASSLSAVGTAGDVIFESGDLQPVFCSSAGQAAGQVVFVGHGIHGGDELAYDDYAGLDVEGRVVAILRGTPAGEPEARAGADDSHGPLGWGGRGTIFHKVMEAKRRGALGVLILPRIDDLDGAPLAYDPSQPARASIPVLALSGSAGKLLLGGALEQYLATGQPVNMPGAQVSMSVDLVERHGSAHNVIGRLKGVDRSKTIVVGAHFDHLGYGGEGSLAPGSFGQIHNGADDNASGTAVVLEMARLMAAGDPPPVDVLFALWSGEELGLLGSEFWITRPHRDLTSIIANLNLDMVGRAGGAPLQVLGAGTAAAFKDLVTEAGARSRQDLRVSLSGQGVGGSDHQTFLRRAIPALHLFSGLHSDYHKPSDDTERFESEGAVRVARMALDLVQTVSREDDLAYIAPPEPAEGAPQRDTGFRTRFGSIPDYAFDGNGMRLSGTSAGGPAEAAGLFEGDVLLRVDDLEIGNISDFMFALNSHKPGDVVAVQFLRDGEVLTTKVTLVPVGVE